jgi:hypothetical protein
VSKRQHLRDHIEFLANKYRADLPFAATVLRSLAGAMELDIDAGLSRVVLDWMIAECKLMGEELDRGCSQAGLPGYSFSKILEANADTPSPPRIDPSVN